MKVKVTLELEVEDGMDSRSDIEWGIDKALCEFAHTFECYHPEQIWEEYKIKWEEISPS